MSRFPISTSNLALLSAIALISAVAAPARAHQPDAQQQAAALLSAATQPSLAAHRRARSGFDHHESADAQQQAGQVLLGRTRTALHRVADAIPSPRPKRGAPRRARLAALDDDDAQTVAGRLLSGKAPD